MGIFVVLSTDVNIMLPHICHRLSLFLFCRLVLHSRKLEVPMENGPLEHVFPFNAWDLEFPASYVSLLEGTGRQAVPKMT